jgi:minor extracellular serine protease Vpr
VSRRYLVLIGVMALFATMAPALAATTPTASVAAAVVDAPDRSLDRTALDAANKPAPSLDEVIQVFIQLSVPSVAEFAATQKELTGSTPTDIRQRIQRNAVLAQQARLRIDLAPYIVAERSALQIGANGFRAMVVVRDIPAIRATAGVASVGAVAIHTRTNATSVPWIGADTAWSSSGETGFGVSIAIIDTGIDYYHANFGGSGDPTDFEDDDPTTIEPGSFPTSKVVGGYDFVGDGYDASADVGSPIPAPDADPLDCHGHGTHVAGSAAGYGVEDDGSTFPGPYNASTFGNSFDIGPGVAPGAVLYALKVFGCDGSTDVTSDAIEWALDPNGDGSISDAVDVINMSLGSPFGSPLDPSAISSNNAVANGVVVVASAGNEGPAAYVTGSPAVAENAISVAASIDGGVAVGATEINSPAELAGLIESSEAAFSVPLSETGPLTGDLVIAEPLIGCTPLTNAGDIAGNIAFVQRGTCPFVDKYINAQAAGAIGLVVFDNSGGPPLVMAGSVDDPMIPAVFITLADGAVIHDAISGGATVNVTLDSSVVIPKPELADSLADFTSSGPAHFGSGFKPDLAAPGFSIVSANVGTGNKGTSSSGTSMAAPHVAGMAAILRDVYPGLDPAVVKSLLQNSATPAYIAPTNVGTPDEARVTLQGVGIAQLDRAVDLDAYTMPAGVSFGRLNPAAGATYTETVRVHRMENPQVTYDIDISPITSVPGVSVSAPGSVTVPGSGSATFDLTITLDPGAMPPDDGFFSQLEADGRITLVNQGDSDDTLNMAYTASVDPASVVSGSGTLGGVDLTNAGLAAGWAEGFTLTGEGDDVGGAVGAVGVRTNDYGVDVVEFGIAHTAPWNTLSSLETDIFLDVDQDGVDDFILVAADLGLLTGSDPTGQVVTALLNLTTFDFVLEWFALADNNDHVQTLTVDAYGPFGFLEDGDTTFDYTVAVFDLQTDLLAGLQFGSVDLAEVVDGTAGLSQDVAAGDTVSVEDIGVVDTSGMGSHAMLWLYANNAVPDQFGIVDVATTTAPVWPMGAVLEASNVSTDGVTLTWPDAIDADGVVVSYEVWQDGDKLVTLGADSNTYSVAGLDDGVLYDLAVTATDDDGFTSVPLAAMVTTLTDWPNHTVGAFEPNLALWVLRNSSGVETSFSYGDAGDMPLMGDWNCNGIDTVGVYRDGVASLRNANSSGAANRTFAIGDAGDLAIAGDFNGNGCSTIGLYRPSTGEAFIWNSLPADGGSAPAPDITYYFGNPGDKPFTGDFDGDGVDTLGLHRESTGLVYFRNSHTQGIADNEFYFGDPDDRLIAGDWGIVDGVDTPAVFRPSNTVWYFRHTNTQGNADSQFTWGSSSWMPVAGVFGLD